MTHRFNELHDALQGVDGIRFADDFRFADATTLHLGGRPVGAMYCATTAALGTAVTRADSLEIPLLVVGGGSNLVVADGDLPLIAVVADCTDVHIDAERGVLRAEAGAVWDDVVAAAIDAGLGGIECLSGIPGSAGATPVQNVGAYGAEIADVLTRVLLLERATGTVEWVPTEALDLGYRTSNLKHTGRGVVLAIELQLRTDGLSAPLRFGELARRLGVTAADTGTADGVRRPAALVRDAVLELRRGKGMVHDPADHDTWSAGSFFTNPVIADSDVADVRVAVAGLYGGTVADAMPCYPAGEGLLKLSAAWLIERAGFGKGHPGPEAPVRLSTRHTLALTNRGAATTADLVALAREVRAGVRDAFGVTLHPEPVWVGVDIDG
ncbi:UDP-N-acetylmuramate dehydrogenase [Corynebacterium sp. CCM 8864]|uniref:UDP-N-acetylenolpyruvoylglucosamine reductase n=1 Tax=Corynebacterium marambiense TaxID=2765364 RepID=A0ABS0VS22_9CORY|nr:UDP-N-acetylmuramate dehydrogenase [Corynebacterium marambiense]MBI8999575.1 UDP-N-acetylmuramate dehydrogenase [Corynebacterium marambiense]